MTKEEQNKKLDEAIALLKEVAQVQNQEKEHCDCCGAPAYVDWTSFQLKEVLDAQIRKLRKCRWVDLDAQPESRAPGRR